MFLKWRDMQFGKSIKLRSLSESIMFVRPPVYPGNMGAQAGDKAATAAQLYEMRIDQI